eukprot:m.13183 g.13183  ORF g.13183 m.13183 type:complete len:348 (-) comp9620_c0_seq1:56-1099(-)
MSTATMPQDNIAAPKTRRISDMMRVGKRKASSPLDQFEVIEELGRGAFAIVYHVIERKTKKAFAMKKIMLSESVEEATAKKEYDLLKSLKHEHIITVIDCFRAAGQLCLQMELVDGGDLFSALNPNECGLHEIYVRKYMVQLAKGLDYLHQNDIVHCDVKPENVLIDKGEIKICDFGLACVSGLEITGRAQGTESYMPPELVNRRSADPYFIAPSQDTWGFGIVMYAMLFSDLPWEKAKPRDNDFAFFCKKGGVSVKMHPFQYISPRLRLLIKSMLAVLPKNRPSMKTVVEFVSKDKTPWFASDRTQLDIPYGLKNVHDKETVWEYHFAKNIAANMNDNSSVVSDCE